MAELERLLPSDAFAFAVPVPRQARDEACGVPGPTGLPGILIIHRGRALGLEPGRPGGALNHRQRAMFPRLRAAGMRIEVARSFAEAVEQLREMGLTIETGESLTRQVADLFHHAQKANQWGGRP